MDNYETTLKLSSVGQTPHDRATASSSDFTPTGQRKFPIAECIILAGGLRPPPLAQATGQSVLDLRITPSRTVLGSWVDHVALLTRCPLRVVFGDSVPEPALPEHAPDAVTIIRESARYRGPAGVVRDQCIGGDPCDTILVAEGARWLDGDISELLVAHATSGAAVTVATNPDDSPAGMYLLRRETLGLVADRGFIDLKEQWLEKVHQAGLPIFVHRLTSPGTRRLWTHDQFLEAAKAATTQEAYAARDALVA